MTKTLPGVLALRPEDRPERGGILVHSRFLTVQGEGSNAGKLAYFVRLSGCQMWSGVDAERPLGLAPCASICDTAFAGADLKQGGGTFFPPALAARIREELVAVMAGQTQAEDDWRPSILVVFTGGEPLLQLTTPEGWDLMRLLREETAALPFHVRFCLETNGSVPVHFPLTRDKGGLFHHVTLSPKKPFPPATGLQWRATELKVLYPLMNPLEIFKTWRMFLDHGKQKRTRLWVQPVDLGSAYGQNNGPRCFAFVRDNPDWRISVQGHKSLSLL